MLRSSQPHSTLCGEHRLRVSGLTGLRRQVELADFKKSIHDRIQLRYDRMSTKHAEDTLQMHQKIHGMGELSMPRPGQRGGQRQGVAGGRGVEGTAATHCCHGCLPQLLQVQGSHRVLQPACAEDDWCLLLLWCSCPSTVTAINRKRALAFKVQGQRRKNNEHDMSHAHSVEFFDIQAGVAMGATVICCPPPPIEQFHQDMGEGVSRLTYTPGKWLGSRAEPQGPATEALHEEIVDLQGHAALP